MPGPFLNEKLAFDGKLSYPQSMPIMTLVALMTA